MDSIAKQKDSIKNYSCDKILKSINLHDICKIPL